MLLEMSANIYTGFLASSWSHFLLPLLKRPEFSSLEEQGSSLWVVLILSGFWVKMFSWSDCKILCIRFVRDTCLSTGITALCLFSGRSALESGLESSVENANLCEGLKHLHGFDQKLLWNFSPGDFLWALSCQSSLSRAEIVSLPECSLLRSGEALLSFYPPVALLLLFWRMYKII